jgi:glucokinase
VAQGIEKILDPAMFRAAFEAHPPYQKLMASIPTLLVTCPEPGLIGCAAYAEQEI